MPLPFLLQRLPFLALDKVVGHFKIIEILNLLKCSRKTCSLIKRWTKRMDIELKVEYGPLVKNLILKMGEICFHLNFTIPTSSLEPENAHDWKFGDCDPLKFFTELLWASSVKDSVAFNTIIDFLVENFNVKRISFHFGYADHQEAYKVLEHANSKGLKLKSINWQIIFTPHEILKNILKIGANEHLIIHFNVLNEFQLDTEILKNLSTNRLRMRANWVTLDYICAMKNVSNIELEGLKLSDEELNTILKKWISGALNFDSMMLGSRRYNVNKENVLDGTDAEALQNQNIWNTESFLIRKADKTSDAIVEIRLSRLYLKRH